MDAAVEDEIQLVAQLKSLDLLQAIAIDQTPAGIISGAISSDHIISLATFAVAAMIDSWQVKPRSFSKSVSPSPYVP